MAAHHHSVELASWAAHSCLVAEPVRATRMLSPFEQAVASQSKTWISRERLNSQTWISPPLQLSIGPTSVP